MKSIDRVKEGFVIFEEHTEPSDRTQFQIAIFLKETSLEASKFERTL